MTIQFQFTFSDFVHAQKLHRRPERDLDVVVPMCGAIVLAAGMAILRMGSTNFRIGTFIMFAGGMLLLLYPLLVRVSWRYGYRRVASRGQAWTLEFTENLIGSQTTYAKSELEWSAVGSFKEDEDIFLLYLVTAGFFMVPKRACTSEQIEELRTLFQQRVS